MANREKGLKIYNILNIGYQDIDSLANTTSGAPALSPYRLLLSDSIG